MAIIYATCYAPTYFRKIQDTSVDSTSLVTLEVARNRRNFCCARSRVAILLASLILINSRRRQTKRTLPTTMPCSSVVKAFFVPKRWYRDRQRLVMSEYVENPILKNRANVHILTSDCHIIIHNLLLRDHQPQPNQVMVFMHFLVN